jgi:hypothetical protein
MQISGKHLRLLAIIVLASLMIVNVPASPKVSAAPVIRRVSPIPINVVLIGFDAYQINANYLVWNGTYKNLPRDILNVVNPDGFSPNSTGVVFKPEYKVTFAPDSFKQDLLTYMTSIEQDKRGSNPWFVYLARDPDNPDYWVSTPVSINYVTYDANSVEGWLWGHLPSLGLTTDGSWTIIVSYLPELPSVSFYDTQRFLKTAELGRPDIPSNRPHYYNISATDPDLGYTFPNRDFMKAWGGHHRMWFVDLSAGPVALGDTNTALEDLPLQVVVPDNNIDLSTDFGKNWLTEYVADYVFDATYSFVARDFVYYPRYSPEYQIDVNILDDRTDMEKSTVPIQKTVNQFAISAAIKDLVPYSNVTVNLHIQNTPQELQSLIQSEYKYTDSWIYGNYFAMPLRYGVVDLRPIYKYIMDNYDEFEPKILGSTLSRKTIPVFAFAFSGETYFTYTAKWYIQNIDWDTRATLGISFNEGVFISLNQYQFTHGQVSNPPQWGKGRGFTQTIIHELGHEFGLSHPHDSNSIGDFFASPMGYFTEEYKFDISDKDSIQRAHVDELYLQTQMILTNDPESSANSDLINQARSKLMQVDSDYAKMDYADAIKPALAALQLAQEAAATGSMQNVTQTMTSQTTASGNYSIGAGTMIYIVAGIAVGLVLGFAISTVLKRRKL